MNSLHSIWYHWVPRFIEDVNVDPGQESQPAKRSPALGQQQLEEKGDLSKTNPRPARFGPCLAVPGRVTVSNRHSGGPSICPAGQGCKTVQLGLL